LGLGSAIMAAETQEESEKVLRSCFIIQYVLSTILCLLFIMMYPSLNLFTTRLPYFISVLFMYLYLNLSIHSSLMNVYINRLGDDKVLFINPLINALCTLLITLPLGLIGWDSIGLATASIISLVLANIHMLYNHNPYSKKFHYKDISYIFRKYKRFVLFQYPSNLVEAFSGQLPLQMISRFFGNTALGDFSMTNKVFRVPLSVISTPIQIIYFRTISERMKNGEDIADLTYSLITKILLVAVVPLVLGVAFAEDIFAFVLGSQWRAAGTIASIMAFPFLFNFCYNCVTFCRVVIGQQKVNLIITLLHLLIMISSLLIGIFVLGSLFSTIICFSITETVYSIFNLYANFYYLKKNASKFLFFIIIYLIVSVLLIGLLKI